MMFGFLVVFNSGCVYDSVENVDKMESAGRFC